MSALIEKLGLKVKPNPDTKKDYSIKLRQPVVEEDVSAISESKGEEVTAAKGIEIPAEFAAAAAPEQAYLEHLLREKYKALFIDDEEELADLVDRDIASGVTLEDLVAVKKPGTPAVKKQPLIVDRRGEGDGGGAAAGVGFNRDAFLRGLMSRGVVKPKLPTEVGVGVGVASAVAVEEPAEDAPETRKSKPTIRVRPTVKKVKTVRIKRKTAKPVAAELPLLSIEEYQDTVIGDVAVKDRIKREPDTFIRADSYYMNNRKYFVQFINGMFEEHKDTIEAETKELSCATRKTGDFALLTHQRLVRDYLNLYTPYRGLLLYHGLGSGKTCSSIAIAEGMKSEKQVIVMTPASLRANYVEQLKFCGDTMYKRNQFWEFISVEDKEEYIEPLASILGLTKRFIKKQRGAWMVNQNKKSNYAELGSDAISSLDKQLDKMIEHKYKFLSYNGMRLDTFKRDYPDYSKNNPFDNKVIIVDEAHNLISRIVNKIEMKKETLPKLLYELLLSAENCRIVFLTGTPIINYPNEIGIMYNILRGYIKSYSIKINKGASKEVNEKILRGIYETNKHLDYVEYNPANSIMTVTRNPYGFKSKLTGKKGAVKYNGVKYDDKVMDDDKFLSVIKRGLTNNEIEYEGRTIRTNLYKALPDKLDEFKNLFIDFKTNSMNADKVGLFQRRIIGLTSYFRDITELMPMLKDVYVVKIPMSDYQFEIYEAARKDEREQEKRRNRRARSGGDGLYNDVGTTYRIYSRQYCNFVFPPEIPRPLPKGEDLKTNIENDADENVVDAINPEDLAGVDGGEFNADDVESIRSLIEDKTDEDYGERLKTALRLLKVKSDEYLTPEGLAEFSPKYLNVLENIQNPENLGLHLIYSQFRTMEGIGIFQLVLEQNGYARFRIKKNEEGDWVLNIPEADMGKPKYGLYTGMESVEEKEIVRNIFNGDWDNVPDSIVGELEKISGNNKYGEVIKVIMITASGAEGLNLKNVRYVHVMEPYWHPVRMEQVIGRAKRICSHEELKVEEQTVEVFLYLMTFTEDQKDKDKHYELVLKDKGKLTDEPLTSDEYLNEISEIKSEINTAILNAMKNASIDCVVHHKEGDDKCMTFGIASKTSLAYDGPYPSEGDNVEEKLNVKEVAKKFKDVKTRTREGEVVYAMLVGTNMLYDKRAVDDAIATGANLPDPIKQIVTNEAGKKVIRSL